MELSKIRAINRLNIACVDICDRYVDVKFMIACGGETRDPQTYRKHSHSYFQLHYIIQGNMVYEIDENIVAASAGNVLLVPACKPHSVVNKSDDYFKITVSFNVESDSDIFKLLNVADNYLYKISPDAYSGIRFVTEQANKRGSYCEMLIKKRLTEMVYLLADKLSNGETKKNENDNSDDRMLKAIKYIEDNPNVFFKCYEVAYHCGISTKQLGRLFRKYMDSSFLDFIHAQKIDDACGMLLNTNKSLDTIAKELGFSSINYFSKFFIFEMGIAPTEYRKKHRKVMSKEGEKNEKN